MMVFWFLLMFILALCWCLVSYVLGVMNLDWGDWLGCLAALTISLLIILPLALAD